MTRLFPVIIAMLVLGRVAVAQPVAVLGKPLPDPSLATGTLVVRVVAGTATSPVGGVVVTANVDGKPRTATTTAEGRATFTNLAIGAKVDISAPSAVPDLAHGSLVVPASGGIRMMLSTASWSAAAAPPRPRPRTFSGEVLPEGAPGTLVVRLSYDDLSDPTPPAKVPVTLVGYAADGTVSLARQPTDATGTATFRALDAGRRTAYFAFAQLTRGTIVDRLVSNAATLDAKYGARVVLSSQLRTSTEPAIDLGATPVAKDKVRVELEGVPEPSSTVELIDAATRKPVAKATTKAADRFVEIAVKPAAGQVVYAQATMRGETYRSRPMLLLADRGVTLSVVAMPRTPVTFDLIGHFEPAGFAVVMKVTIANNAWIPLAGTRAIPLPAGFTDPELDEITQLHAKLTKTGIELTTPIPPGGLAVLAGFTLPVKADKARFAMELPEGAIDSAIRVDDDPGVALELPPGVPAATPWNGYQTVSKIAIAPKQSFVFSVHAPVLDARQRAIVAACSSLSPNRRSPLIGKPMPDFTAPSLDGTPLKLSSLRGTQLIVTFNASWNHSHDDETTLPKLALPKTTQVVAVMSDPNAAVVTKAFGKLPFRVVLDRPIGDEALGPITGAWGITAVPETYVVDRTGIVRAHFVNFRDWTDKAVPGCLRALE